MGPDARATHRPEKEKKNRTVEKERTNERSLVRERKGEGTRKKGVVS